MLNVFRHFPDVPSEYSSDRGPDKIFPTFCLQINRIVKLNRNQLQSSVATYVTTHHLDDDRGSLNQMVLICITVKEVTMSWRS